MNADLTIMLILAGTFLALFAIAELLYHKAGVRAEYTRKIVHGGTGLLTLLFPVFLSHFWQVAVLCSSFLLLLFASRKWGVLPSINAVKRDTLGSLLYPVIVALLFLFYQYAARRNFLLPSLTYFELPILIMALCDPLAAAVGQRLAAKRPALQGRKTWAGSIAFFTGTVLITGIGFSGPALGGTVRLDTFLALLFTLALSTTFAERWSKRGWDNFTIPATAATVLWGFECLPT